MPLPAVTETLDNVEPSQHSLYAQTESGTFVLEIAGDISGHPIVAPLENAYRKEQEKRKRQGRELDALKEKSAAGRRDGGDKNGSETGPLAAGARGKVETTHRHELAAVSNQAEKYRVALEATLIDAALTDALVRINVAAPYMKAAKALHRGSLSIEERDGDFRVIAGSPDQSSSPDEFIGAWAETEEGRAFVAAPRNGGGAAHGSGIAGPRSPNPWRSESFNRTEQARIARDDPALAKRLARAAGRPEPRI